MLEVSSRKIVIPGTPHILMQEDTSPPPTAKTRCTNITILVADESEPFRTKLSTRVKQIPGVDEVIEATRAHEVLARLPLAHPLVALISVQVDERGGGVLLCQIKKTFPTTILIALTRYASPKLSSVFRECGADYCFDKNTDLDSILQTIENVIHQTQLHEPQKEPT